MEYKVKGAELLATLEKIKDGQTYDIFNLLPDIAGGSVWLDEIKDTALYVQGYVNADEDYSIDDIRDYGHEYANEQCETYYKNINDEVQSLSLWASNEIDDEVAELASDIEPKLTTLQSLYLFVAKRMVWDAVVDQAFQNINQDELVGA
jgi:superfamily II DNA or RNA helicase